MKRRTTGNRNRTAVDSALSVYEEVMSRRLGSAKTLECSAIHRRLGQVVDNRTAQKAYQITKIRHNSRHFAGLRFGRERAERDVTFIANTLQQFGEQQGATEVRQILHSIQNGNVPNSLRPTRVRGRSHQSRRNYTERSAQSASPLMIGGIFLVIAGLALVGMTPLDTIGGYVFLGGFVALAVGFVMRD